MPEDEEPHVYDASKPLAQQVEEFCKTCPDETGDCKRTKRCSLRSFCLWTVGCGRTKRIEESRIPISSV